MDEDPAPLAIAQAPLWGFGRVIAQEHPTLWGGLIDLERPIDSDPHVPPRDLAASQLLAELSAPDKEDQIAFRHGRRHVARLMPKGRSAVQGPPLRLRSDGSYLITGGLGDLASL